MGEDCLNIMREIFLFLSIVLLWSQVKSECGYASCPKGEPGYVNIHIVPHTHDDVGWLKTVDQYYYGYRNDIQRAGVQYIIDSVISELLEDPGRRFIYVESAFFWRWWGEQDLTMKETVRELVNQGRLEFISGGWSMNDEAAAHYSAIIDNMAIGIKFFQDEFGTCGRPKVGWQIDPFGHSREYANILAKFGFDGLFLGRIDYADKDKRKASKSMEMMWKAGEGGVEGELFTGINYNTYFPPAGFCFDLLCDDVIMDNKLLEDYNLDQKLEDFKKFARGQAEAFATSNILMTMGGDFNYQDANTWYKNLDKLIKYMNEGKDEHKFNLFYSTPSCYLKAVQEEIADLPSKTDDFFPYASDPHAFWTGYFTSRPALKGIIRKANSLLQACKQVESFQASTEEDPRLMISKHSVSVNQHHDAVTGTAKQHVTDDYYKGLHRGMEACHQIISEGLNAQNQNCVVNDWCPWLNISQCAYTETKEAFTTSVYNSLPRTEQYIIRVPVTDNVEYSIKDIDNPDQIVAYQVTKLPESVLLIPGRDSQARYELAFEAVVPGLQSKRYLLEKGAKEYTATRKIDLAKSGKFRRTALGDDKLKVEVKSTGDSQEIVLKSGEVEATMSFFWYEPAVGNNEVFENRSSGAYIFRPNGTTAVPIGDPAVELFEGPLYKEYHLQYNDWISLVFRQYETSGEDGFGELEWLVGPIPVEDGGKEIIMRYDAKDSTQIQMAEVLLRELEITGANISDSNKAMGLYRETWDLNVTEPISANYYPINTRIGIRDDTNALWVMTDRAEGGTSLESGQLEVMIHRRLLHDDAFGVGEALNEQAFGKGLVVRGTHRVLLCTTGDCELKSSQMSERIFAEPVIQFGEPCFEQLLSNGLNVDGIMIREKENTNSIELPKTIKLLTMEKYAASQILVRLENLATSGEAVTVDLTQLFPNNNIQAVEERTLDGNVAKSSVNRISWNKDSKPDNRIPRYKVDENKENYDEELQFMDVDGNSVFRKSMSSEPSVEIQPGFIQTYLIQLSA